MVLPGKQAFQIRFSDGRSFEFPFADGYWSILLDRKTVYSPEFEPLFAAIADIDYCFVDCGANFGYMSVLATSEAAGKKRAVAIEADPSSAAQARRNAELNDGRFTVLHRAVYSESGKTVRIAGAKHEARSILEDDHGGAEVETLSLSDLVRNLDIPSERPILLKLDLEGVEIDALKGADGLLRHPTLIVYEEHGGDPSHAVSHHLRDEMDMRLWFAGYRGDALTELKNDSDLDRIKRNPRNGYDLFASRDALWLQRLELIAQRHQKQAEPKPASAA